MIRHARKRSWFVSVALGGGALACLSCQDGHARPLAGEVFNYSGPFVTTVEQPDSEQDCGSEHVTFQAGGYLSLDRSARLVRLEGFGCNLSLDEEAGTSFSGSSQDCVADGAVGFNGFGLDALRFDTIVVDPEARTTTWSARAWRSLPGGRVSYCFELNGTLEPR